MNLRLSIDLIVEDSAARLPSVSLNISETGILVRAGRGLPRGSVVKLEAKEFKAKAEIIWTREMEEPGTLLGMKFVSIGRRDSKFVRGLVEGGGGY